jgi:crotonobetainyl-CoA:carnitine CoA-transferase CaiB-like acyl-CoA transferase
MTALDDITVVSFAQMAQGPLATQMLADMGAEVIKIEPPGGEVLRREDSIDADAAADGEDAWLGLNTLLKNQNVTFLALNRNKKSIELDLKDASDKEIAYALIDDADIVVENFRPGVMEKLGFGYEQLSERNSALIYASASGYGSEGPYADKQGQDLLVQGLSGLMTLTGDADSHPTPVGITVIDAYSAMIVAFAIVTALHHRDRTGQGQKIDGDLLSSAMHLLSQGRTARAKHSSGHGPRLPASTVWGVRNRGRIHDDIPVTSHNGRRGA